MIMFHLHQRRPQTFGDGSKRKPLQTAVFQNMFPFTKPLFFWICLFWPTASIGIHETVSDRRLISGPYLCSIRNCKHPWRACGAKNMPMLFWSLGSGSKPRYVNEHPKKGLKKAGWLASSPKLLALRLWPFFHRKPIAPGSQHLSFLLRSTTRSTKKKHQNHASQLAVLRFAYDASLGFDL